MACVYFVCTSVPGTEAGDRSSVHGENHIATTST